MTSKTIPKSFFSVLRPIYCPLNMPSTPHGWQHYIDSVCMISFSFVILNTYNMVLLILTLLLELVARPPALELVA